MEKYYARDYRMIAAEKCNPFSGRLALIYLIYFLVIGVLEGALSQVGRYQTVPPVLDEAGQVVIEAQYGSVGSNIVSLALFVVAGAITLGFIHITKDVFAGRKPEFETMLSGFNMWVKAFVLNLIRGLYVALFSLLLVVPGIIKAYQLDMAEFVLDDNPELSATECLDISKSLMNGHKWELFCLEFSYIGWIILCALTCGILSLWVAPKMAAARYAFYLHISGKDVEEEPVAEETKTEEAY